MDMKYVAEPHMHSMPSVTLSPNGKAFLLLYRLDAESRELKVFFLFSEKWLACQSMDNQVLIYGVHTNFRLNRRKTFKGHMVCTVHKLASHKRLFNPPPQFSRCWAPECPLGSILYVSFVLVSCIYGVQVGITFLSSLYALS